MEETLAAAVAPMGHSGHPLGIASPMGAREFRIGLCVDEKACLYRGKKLQLARISVFVFTINARVICMVD